MDTAAYVCNENPVEWAESSKSTKRAHIPDIQCEHDEKATNRSENDKEGEGERERSRERERERKREREGGEKEKKERRRGQLTTHRSETRWGVIH